MWAGCTRPRCGSRVIADAATKVVNSRHDAHLFNWCLVRARPRKQIGDLGELTFRLLGCGVEFLTKRLAGGILESPLVRPNQLFCVLVGEGNNLPSLALAQNT